MHSLDPQAARAALLTETDLLADLYRDCDPTTPVPTCPGWTLATLVAHVGGGHRWTATIVTRRSTENVAFAEVPDVRRPRDQQAAVAWLRDSARQIITAVDATGPDVPVWTPFGGLRPARWWIRRRLHEDTGHRADALLALGREVVMAPAIAADGLSELLDLIAVGPPWFAVPLEDGTTLTLTATDSATSWSVARSADTVAWTGVPAAATVTVSGAAVDLYLLALRRISADNARLAISGDPKALDTWLDRTAF
ncbi:maleylpyruvate isomerase family mycothiol-dependent enzyme [Frankia sp. AiPa1]|uniref:maleylpyruvate isomerase family mycothiol-dependent enzyme n=1 Tax=Frankia sp. AiPa1 TaxID=573492 RepID=UPI00202B8D57|nr:maleylpyruvate isomerase family mycothiol-dependent enzyme [Frankia sp. AiPa1]MCL9762284.1 maleylpyruvate isomerase family mycothiol-dependent enzyme [Frankia sp. AiPa1]